MQIAINIYMTESCRFMIKELRVAVDRVINRSFLRLTRNKHYLSGITLPVRICLIHCNLMTDKSILII